MGCQALLQGIFPTQGLNPGLLCCRQMMVYQLIRTHVPGQVLSAWEEEKKNITRTILLGICDVPDTSLIAHPVFTHLIVCIIHFTDEATEAQRD